MLTKKELEEKLKNVNDGIEQTKNVFQQLSGQKSLLEGIIHELIEKEKISGELPEGNNL